MSLAKIIAKLVERGEEDLAEEVLTLAQEGQATAQFSSKVKSKLNQAAKRTGGKLTGGGWNQIQVTFSFDSEKDARRFYKSAETADPEGWASPDEPYEQKGQWHVDVNG